MINNNVIQRETTEMKCVTFRLVKLFFKKFLSLFRSHLRDHGKGRRYTFSEIRFIGYGGRWLPELHHLSRDVAGGCRFALRLPSRALRRAVGATRATTLSLGQRRS